MIALKINEGPGWEFVGPKRAAGAAQHRLVIDGRAFLPIVNHGEIDGAPRHKRDIDNKGLPFARYQSDSWLIDVFVYLIGVMRL